MDCTAPTRRLVRRPDVPITDGDEARPCRREAHHLSIDLAERSGATTGRWVTTTRHYSPEACVRPPHSDETGVARRDKPHMAVVGGASRVSGEHDPLPRPGALGS